MYDKIRKLLPVLSKTASFGYISEPKKGDTEVSAAINLSAERLFNCFNYCLECFRLVHRQIGHNLAVEGDALGVDFADKLRIGIPCARTAALIRVIHSERNVRFLS